MHARFSRNRIARSVLRVVVWVFASVLILLGLLALLISTPWGNNTIRDISQSWLRKKLQTDLTIGQFRIHGFQGVTIEDLMVRDRSQDTLIALDTLSISYRLDKILAGTIDLPEILISGLHSELRRPGNSEDFNYQFIIDAFASDESKPDDTASSQNLKIDLGHIRINRSDFLLDDRKTGDYYHTALQTLDLPVLKSDFSGMDFRLGKSRINGLDLEIRTGSSPDDKKDAKQEEENSAPFHLVAEKLQLENTRFILANPNNGLDIQSNAKELSLDKIEYDLLSAHATGGTLLLLDHDTKVQYRSTPDETANSSAQKETSNPFSLVLDSIYIDRTGLAIDDLTKPIIAKKQFDPGHILFQDLLLKAGNIHYDSSGYRARIWDFAFRDPKGVDLQHLEGDLFFSDSALSAKQFVLKTPANMLQGSIALSYASLEKMVSAPANTRISLDIAPSIIRLDELSYYVPAIAQNKSLNPVSRQDIKLRLNASGTLDQLALNNYRIETGGNLFSGQARILHPMEPKRMDLQASISELSGSRKSLRSLMPAGMISDSIWNYIPERFSISGQLNGSLHSIRPDLRLKSSDGNLAIKGTLNDPNDKERATYDLAISADGYNLGRALGDTALGKMAGTATVKGRGFNPETLQAAFDVALKEAGFKGHNYKGIDLHGQMNKGDIQATLASGEPDLDLDAEISMHYGKQISEIMVKSDIRQLDLQALGFSDSILAVKGHVDIRFPKLDSSKLDGTALLDGISLSMGSKTFVLDTISVNAHTAMDSQYIEVRSPLADVDIQGRFSVNAIPGAARTILDNWLVMDGDLKSFPEPLYAEVQANVHIPDSLAPLIPGLKSAAPFIIKGGIDTRQNSMLLLSAIPRIEYADYIIDTAVILLMQIDTIARYKKSRFVVSADRIQGKSFMLNKSVVGAQISKGIVDGTLVFFDAKENERYRLPVKFFNDPVAPYINIPDSVVLNGRSWEVSKDNRVYISQDKFKGSNLQISEGPESISLKADATNPNGLPLTLDITQLQLESITGMFIGEIKLLTGTVNGKAQLTSMTPIGFQADLSIDSLTLVGSSFGNLHTKAETTADNRYKFNLTLKEAGNDFAAGGTFQPSDGAMDIQVHMAPLNLTPLAPFLSAYVDSVRGGLRGDIKIGGTTKNPNLDGRLALDSSYMVIRQTGTPLYIPEASLLFEGQQIQFQGMRLLDSAGRPAMITGTGRAEHLTDISYDLKIQSDKFLVSGKKRYEEQLVSGPLYAGLSLNVKGDMELAAINGTISIIDSSVATYIYRPDDKGTSGEGLIEFFDPLKKDSADSLLVVTRIPKKPGLKLSVNNYIKVTPSSTVNIVLDELTGDQLTVKGNANLNFTMDPGGQMEMTGNYEVESGSYNMTIGGLLKKSFVLQKGSTITWSGDILKANTDLTAMYTVRTDAEELLREVESVPGANRQKFDFEVYMLIKGELLKPAITFRLDMPVKEQSAFNGVVYTRLRQVNSIPSELNKQVMGLLALNSFIADNPFNSLTSGGGSFETQAFSTAGRLLTQELNSFLGNVIKDVDIDVGLDIRDDYTSGQAQRRSDLKVGFTKSLANNRLSIYVGNTFALENHNQNTNAMAGLAGNVSIEYLLTNDGKYRIKGYRLSEESLTFNGIVVETGVTFVVVLEFNRFKNLFRSKKKKNMVLS